MTGGRAAVTALIVLVATCEVGLAADRFDVYPSAESACRTLASELATLVANSPELKGRNIVISLQRRAEPEEAASVLGLVRLGLREAGVPLFDSPKQTGSARLVLVIEKAGERFAVSASLVDPQQPALAVSYVHAEWVEKELPFFGICEAADSASETHKEARRKAVRALLDRIEAGLPQRNILDKFLAWKRGEEGLLSSLDNLKENRFEQRFVKGDLAGKWRGLVRVRFASISVSSAVEGLKAERVHGRRRVYLLGVVWLVVVGLLVFFGIRLDLRYRGYLTSYVRVGCVFLAVVAFVICFALC